MVLKKRESVIDLRLISKKVKGSPDSIRYDSNKWKETIKEAEETVLSIFEKKVENERQKKQDERMGLE